MTVTMPKRKTALALVAATAMAAVSLVLTAPAVATATEDVPAIVICGPAYTETIPAVPGTDAVYETVTIPAVTETVTIREAVPGLWANFAPNHTKGPFEGPPLWPTDEGGEWNIHPGNGGPGKDEVGVFQQGNGNGSWFYRQVAAPAVTEERVVTPATTVERLVTEAVPGTPERVIEHPAVECPPVETEEPPVLVTPPVETTEPTATPVAVVAPEPTQTPEAEVMTTLPRTGGGDEVPLFAGIGGALLLLGAGLLARKRLGQV